jgi:aspartate/methionine/tyrosine aminotransferase
VLQRGDEVLVERPAYDPLLGVPRFLGAEVRRFDRVFEEGFRVDPDRVAAAITPRTRLIFMTNPHNPTGAYTPPDVLLEVGRVAEGVGAKVLVDEVYLESIHGMDLTPAATLSPTFISTSSLTKAYGLSGLRAGWALAEPGLAEGIRRVRDIVDGVGSFPSELLAHLAFRNLPALRERARGILEPNLARLTDFMATQSRLEWVPPAGGSVGFPRIVGADDASGFVKTLREGYRTGVVPGRFFEAPPHFRIALGGRRDVLQEGLRRLGQAVDALLP